MGKFYIGEFLDDDQRTALRTQLLRFAPTEFILHKKAVLPHTIQLLHQECSSALISYVDPTSSLEVMSTMMISRTASVPVNSLSVILMISSWTLFPL